LVLRSAGYAIEDNVRFAASGAETAAIFDKIPDRSPNVVLCDFRLRDGESANDVIRLLDDRFAWQINKVPVIVFSAEINPSVDTQRPCLRVVVKSGDSTVLVRQIDRLLEEASAPVADDDDD